MIGMFKKVLVSGLMMVVGGMIKKGLMVILCLGLVLSWGLKAKAEPFSLPSERDKEEMRMERSKRNGIFDRLKAREEERRLRQMPDERRREYEEQKKAERTKRSMRSPALRAAFAQAQAGTKLTDHQFYMAHDGFPNNNILFLSDRGGQFDLWKMDENGGSLVQLTNDSEVEVEAVVSPPGQKIAYVSFDFNGQQHLYVMNANGTGRVEIDVSSEWIDVGDNFWSPDGNWLLYEKEGLDDNEFWVVKADGTGKKQLPEEIRGWLFWSPNSQLAYTYLYNNWQNNESGIYTVDVDTLVTATIVSSTAGWFGDPAYSPDGNWIVYTDYNKLCKIPSSGGQPIILVTETSPCNINDPVCSPNGNWIAYSKNDWENNSYDIIYVVSNNGGTSVLINEEGWDFIWSPDSQWLLYENDDGFWAVRADGTVKNQLPSEGEMFSGGYFFLSDSSRVAYCNVKDIYTIPVAGGSPSNLTNNPYSAINAGPVFSPDGNKMAYLTMPNKDATGLSWRMGLWVMNSNGSGKKEILSDADADIDEIIWSPDGNWIAYRYYDWNNDVSGIYKISPDGGTPIPIVSSTNSWFGDPTYSPDGKHIAYSYDDWQNNEYGIYTVDVDTLVTATIVTSTTGEFNNPTYSPDGKDIAYAYSDWQSGGKCGIYTVDVDTLVTATIVTSTTGEFDNPTYSPDGNYIAYVYYGSDEDGLYVASSDSSSFWLVYDGGWVEDFCWSPDSTKLAFSVEEGNDLGNSYQVNLDGSNLTKLNATNTFSFAGGIDWSSQNIIAYTQNFDIWINTQQTSDKPILTVTPPDLTFKTRVGENPANQAVEIKAIGGTGSLSWTASSNQTWLVLSSSSGQTPATLALSVHAGSLGVGSYQAKVTIDAPGAAEGSSPKVIRVNLNVRYPEVDCEVIKTAHRNVAAGNILIYTIYAVNRGADSASAVVAVDTLPAGVIYQASSSGGSYNQTAHTVTWNLGTLTGGSLKSLTLDVLIPTTATSGTVLNNSVRITTPDTETITTNNLSTHQAGIVSPTGADLEVYKSVTGETSWIKRGFELYYHIYYNNYDLASAENTKLTDYLPKEVEYLSSSDNGAYNSITHSVSWDIGSVSPYGSGYRKITVRIPADTENGAELTNKVDIETTSSETDYANNSFTQSVIVGAAIDPNDKSVYPAGDIKEADLLRYVIRYENTGSMPTTIIKVEDVLDDNLDEGTLVIGGGGSYDASTRKISWTDNNSLDPGVTRAVMFMVMPTSGLSHGTQIKNKATIYFDYEPGLETNEVVSCITKAAPNLNNIRVYPNPFKPYDEKPETGRPYSSGVDDSGIIFDQLTEGAKIKIFNLAGELVVELSSTGGLVRWDAKNESGKEVASGVYIYLITDSGKKTSGKLAIIR